MKLEQCYDGIQKTKRKKYENKYNKKKFTETV